MVKKSLMITNFWGVFFNCWKTNSPQKTLSLLIYLLIYIYIKSFWLEWGLAMNRRAFMALKWRCHQIRSFTFLMNGTIALLSPRGIWMDMKCLCVFHNRNTLWKFFKCFVICTPHFLIHGACFSVLQFFMIKSIPTGASYETLAH
jgi:hypothetical protein